MEIINQQQIGSYIKNLRLKAGYSQLEAACRLCFCEKQYRRIEKNGSDKISVLESVASLYNIDLRDLINAGIIN